MAAAYHLAMATAKTALRIKVDDPEKGSCPAVIAFNDGTVVDTAISTFSELRAKASDHGLDMGRDVVASPTTVAWLKDQEGWPDDTETVGRV